MAKLRIIFVCMFMELFGSSQSTSFECKCYFGLWGDLGKVYRCDVENSVNITSLEDAQFDDIAVTHLAGYNNDNVEVFYVNSKGQIHYFPQGLNKFFKNLNGIEIGGTGLKEIHQSDLKDFPKLMALSLSSSNLEIIEENLFEFNPNLDYIYLHSNKISYIDPNVFDQLTKLKSLNFQYNLCINIDAYNNPTELQNLIKTAKSQCTSSYYSNLDQKLKNLETESKNLNSENLNEKLENLKNELKNSKFSNTFHGRLQDLKAAQIKKAREENRKTVVTKELEICKFESCSALELKVNNIAADLKELMIQAINGTNSNNIGNNHQQNEHCAAIKKDLRNQTEAIERIDNRTETFTEAMDTRMEILEENVENFKMSALREIQNIKNAVKDAHHGLMMSMNFKADKMEKQNKKIEEQNRKLEDNLEKILKALKTDD